MTLAEVSALLADVDRELSAGPEERLANEERLLMLIVQLAECVEAFRDGGVTA